MTATKTKQTKLIVREEEFATLIRQRKELAESRNDIDATIKTIDEKIFQAMEKEKLTSVNIENVGIAEIVQTGGSVTWDQEKLMQALVAGANLRQIDTGELMVKVCKLTARESVAKEINLDILSAKKVGKFTDKLKIS